MFQKIDNIVVATRQIRQRCVRAHNMLVQTSGYSVLHELRRCIKPDTNFPNNSDKHLFLSSYAFWGHRELGSSRHGFENRLRRILDRSTTPLYKQILQGAFGAWECTEAPIGKRQPSTWRLVGGGATEVIEVPQVTDVKGNPVDVTAGQVRAGWIVEIEDIPFLLFSIEIEPQAAKRLLDTERAGGWQDDDEADEEILRVEYERDVLTQAICPDFEQCGLEPLYYLPPAQRKNFPADFKNQMTRELCSMLKGEEIPWHIQLAIAEEGWAHRYLSAHLYAMRERAERRARYYHGKTIELGKLEKLLPDPECFALIGLKEDATIALDNFPPLSTHPIDLLGLPPEFFDEAGLSPMATIHEAKFHLKGKDEDMVAAFEEALDGHLKRLRWVSLMGPIVENEKYDSGKYRFSHWSLTPDYDALRKVVDVVFGPTITDLPVRDLFPPGSRLTTRTETCLLQAGLGEAPLKIGDLPRREYQLSAIPGVGPKSVECIISGLLEMLLSWPPGLAGGSQGKNNEARAEIDDGLDELEDLFG